MEHQRIPGVSNAYARPFLEIPEGVIPLIRELSEDGPIVINEVTLDKKAVSFTTLEDFSFSGVAGDWPDGAPLAQSPDFYIIQDGYVYYDNSDERLV